MTESLYQWHEKGDCMVWLFGLTQPSTPWSMMRTKLQRSKRFSKQPFNQNMVIWKFMCIRLRIEDMAFDLFSQVVLGTGPRDVPTHWKQTILLLLGDGGQSLEEDEVSFKTQMFRCTPLPFRWLAGSWGWSRVKSTLVSIRSLLRFWSFLPSTVFFKTCSWLSRCRVTPSCLYSSTFLQPQQCISTLKAIFKLILTKLQ